MNYFMLPTIIRYALRSLIDKPPGTRILIDSMYDFTIQHRRLRVTYIYPESQAK